MDKLPHDASKFKNLGPADQNDNTAKIELQIQCRLLELKKNLIPIRIYKAIQPTDTQCPRIYGLPCFYAPSCPYINLQKWSLLFLILCSIFFLRTVYLTLLPSLKLSEIFNFLLHLRFSVPLIFPLSLPTFPCKKQYFL